MMFPKPVRQKDKKALEKVRKKPCCCCGTWQLIHAHHIKSRGSGGPDTLNNLLPLCFRHHTEIHQIGLTKMLDLYSGLASYIREIK